MPRTFAADVRGKFQLRLGFVAANVHLCERLLEQTNEHDQYWEIYTWKFVLNDVIFKTLFKTLVRQH